MPHAPLGVELHRRSRPWIGSVVTVAPLSLFGLYCWRSRNPCKRRRREEEARLRETIVQVQVAHDQKLNAMAPRTKSYMTEVLILVPSPEFGKIIS